MGCRGLKSSSPRRRCAEAAEAAAAALAAGTFSPGFGGAYSPGWATSPSFSPTGTAAGGGNRARGPAALTPLCACSSAWWNGTASRGDVTAAAPPALSSNATRSGGLACAAGAPRSRSSTWPRRPAPAGLTPPPGARPRTPSRMFWVALSYMLSRTRCRRGSPRALPAKPSDAARIRMSNVAVFSQQFSSNLR